MKNLGKTMPADRAYAYVSSVRRFSHLLTGTARDGDSLVSATLTSFTGQKLQFSRIDVYKRVIEIWTESVAAGCEEPGSIVYPGAGVDNALQQLSPNAKLAFLLIYVEEFPPQDAAHILEVSVAELKAHISLALQELSGIRVDTLKE